MITYKSFKKLNINTESVGFILCGDDCIDFCTPVGAEIIGSAGVDGIYYCFIQGFGDTVFSVNPMNPKGDCVQPIAESFEMFLRLLLSCGSEAAIEQAHSFSREEFDYYLSEYPPDEEQQAVLCEIKDKLNLQPIENPYEYIRNLQSKFDYSSIEYKPEYYDDIISDEEEESITDWNVFYHGDFWGHFGRERAGEEISIDKHFLWSDREWYIPAVYYCASGVVIDFCVKVEPKSINEFNSKFNFDCEDYSIGQLELIDAENPMQIDFKVQPELNGKRLYEEESCCEIWYPEECLENDEENDIYSKSAVKHYNLDKSYGWIIHRSKFRRVTKTKPKIRALSITLEEEPCAVHLINFSVDKAGESVDFVHPLTGVCHTLKVLKYEKEELSLESLELCDNMPNRCIIMTYDVTPSLNDEEFAVRDCATNDSMNEETIETDNDSSVVVVGCCDGPTAIYITSDEEPKYRTALSALHYEFPDSVEWRMVFYNKMHEDITVKLI